MAGYFIWLVFAIHVLLHMYWLKHLICISILSFDGSKLSSKNLQSNFFLETAAA